MNEVKDSFITEEMTSSFMISTFFGVLLWTQDSCSKPLVFHRVEGVSVLDVEEVRIVRVVIFV